MALAWILTANDLCCKSDTGGERKGELVRVHSCVNLRPVCSVPQHMDGSYCVKPLKQKQVVSICFSFLLLCSFSL